jgi:ABC-type branched-subunit amino acid transport system substrate-binding protein
MVAGLDSYAKLINENGGIGGRRIRVVSYDDRLDPTQMLTNVKRLVERDQVFAIFGLWMDSALEYLTQKQIPALSMGVTAPPYSSKYPTTFPLQANVLTWNQQFAEAVTQHMNIKPKRVGIIYDTTLFDERPYLPFFRDTWKEFGAEVVAMEPMNLSDGDCTSVALKMQSANIDLWNFETLAWPLCISAMDRIGWKPPMGMGGWPASAAGVGNIVGPSVAGIIAMNVADQPDGSPRKKTAAHDDYVRTVAKYYPKMNRQGSLESSATLGYYTGMRLFTEGLKSVAPNFTRAAVVSWLQGVKNFDLQIQPPVKSLAPTCKQGTGETWWAPWQWDKSKNEAFRKPATPYVGTSRFAAKYGGECFVTRIADQIVGK